MFEDLLDEIEGFKYQIILKVLLSNFKENANREFSTVCFNSTAKTVINHKYNFEKSFQEIFNIIDNWISERSGWIIE